MNMEMPLDPPEVNESEVEMKLRLLCASEMNEVKDLVFRLENAGFVARSQRAFIASAAVDEAKVRIVWAQNEINRLRRERLECIAGLNNVITMAPVIVGRHGRRDKYAEGWDDGYVEAVEQAVIYAREAMPE